MTRCTVLVVAATTLLPCLAQSQQVTFERTGYRLTSIGERVAVAARVGGRKPPSVRYRVADPTIATVTPQGVVESKRVGYTRLWAIVGSDSASALILVDQWAARFDFSPSVVRLDAVGAKSPLRVQVRDAVGHLIADNRSRSCRVLNDRVATWASTGEVSAVANGVTWVRCTDRGLADSVRIEVRQRVASVKIPNKQFYERKQVGETFSLQIEARGRGDLVIKDATATWASMNPSVVAIDPTSGFARMVGPGDAKVVAQAGDVTDTVGIHVEGGAGILMAGFAGSDSASSATGEARIQRLRIDGLFPFEGDTTQLRYLARDATGNEDGAAVVTFQSRDSTVVRLVGQRVLARKPGTAFIIGRYGAITDSALVTVRARSTRVASGIDTAAGAAFNRPRFNVDSLTRIYNATRDSAQRRIFDSSRVLGLKKGGLTIYVAGVAGQAAYSSRLDANVVEKRTGLLYGGTAEIAPFHLVKLSANLRTGTLSTGQNTGQDLTVTEAEGDLTVRPADWFGLRGGYVLRAMREGSGGTPVSTQRWSFPRVSALTRFTFIGGAVATTAGISVLPGASYTGYYDNSTPPKPVKPDPFSLAGETGIELRNRYFNAGLVYYVERFSFPKVAGNERVDQFSTLRLSVGLLYGR